MQEDETDEDSFHYEVDGTKYYAVEQDTIRELQAEKHLDYIDARNGKILQMKGVAPEDHPAVQFFGYMYVGYEISVTDEKTGELLYRGKLVTDFEEDYNRRLVAVNIGQQAESIQERENPVDWDKYTGLNSEERNVGRMLPLEGRFYDTTWAEGYRWSFREGEYYY